jgi:plastocyanin
VLPAGPPVVSPTAPALPPLTDDRYEFCDRAPERDVQVTVSTYERKFDRGCYRAPAGVPLRLSFTNRTTVPHNVVAIGVDRIAFAKTETRFVADGARAAYDSTGLGTLAPGDYELICDLHPTMHAQLVVR